MSPCDYRNDIAMKVGINKIMEFKQPLNFEDYKRLRLPDLAEIELHNFIKEYNKGKKQKRNLKHFLMDGPLFLFSSTYYADNRRNKKELVFGAGNDLFFHVRCQLVD